MVDFARIMRERYENASPEERARIDAFNEQEARYEATRRTIHADFARFGEKNTFDFTKKRNVYETFVSREWSSDIEMRIEDRTGYDGRKYEIIRFIGGSTGHESYELSEDFVSILREETPGIDPDLFTICAGSAKYDRCSVSCHAVLEYLSEVRPSLAPPTVPDVQPAPETRRPPWMK